MIPLLYILRLFTALSLLSKPFAYAWINYPSDGTATLTHYDLPKVRISSIIPPGRIHVTLHATQDYIAACGCTGKSTHYPTAALNQKAFGSNYNYGPGCGRCFKLTLLNSYTGSPPFFPDTHPSVVVKVTDLCPLTESGWCSGTENKTNPYVFVRSDALQRHQLRVVVAGAVNTLILILHTPRPRSQTTSSPQTRSYTDTKHVFSLRSLVPG